MIICKTLRQPELNLSKPHLYADTLNMRNYMYVIALISLRLRSITRYSVIAALCTECFIYYYYFCCRAVIL